MRVWTWLRERGDKGRHDQGDPLDIVTWSSAFIPGKVVGLLAIHELTLAWGDEHEPVTDGSAKVVLLAIERAHAAWLALVEGQGLAMSAATPRTVRTPDCSTAGAPNGSAVSWPAETSAAMVTSCESDRLVRGARIVGGALALFEGDRGAAARCLTLPQRGLGGALPCTSRGWKWARSKLNVSWSG